MVKKTIPTGWTNYTNFGHQLPGTKFVPLKTPLKDALTRNRLPSEKWFTPEDVLEQLPRLKLVINLTGAQSGRYYDYDDFRNAGITVAQIVCEGHGVLPTKKQLERFYRTVDYFERNQAAYPEGLIGVHCTHGLNRTGYFICKYLVERDNMAPNAAIELFEVARGHQIERHQYLTDLRSSANWRVSGGGSDMLYHMPIIQEGYIQPVNISSTPSISPPRSSRRLRSAGRSASTFNQEPNRDQQLPDWRRGESSSSRMEPDWRTERRRTSNNFYRRT